MHRFASIFRSPPAALVALVLATSSPWASADFGAFAFGKVVEHASAKFKAPTPAPVAFPEAGSFTKCAHLFPGGVPLDIRSVDARWKPRAMCASNYAVVYSGLTKTPLLVIEKLTKAQLADALDETRTDEFFSDPRIPAGERAELSDYAGSGYDRGHMAPAADMPNPSSMAQSFALSNMIPQDPFNNRKTWAKIESDTRKYVRRASGDVFVFSAPQFRGPAKTIGRNKVWVPTHLAKLVHDASTGRAWAHMLENTAEARVAAPRSYADFAKETGWDPLRGMSQ